MTHVTAVRGLRRRQTRRCNQRKIALKHVNVYDDSGMFIQQKMSKGYRFPSDALSSSLEEKIRRTKSGGVGWGVVGCGAVFERNG